MILQQRFLIERSSQNSGEINYVWWVPVTFTSDFTMVDHVWLSEDDQVVTLSLPQDLDTEQWIIANVNQTGKLKQSSNILNFIADFEVSHRILPCQLRFTKLVSHHSAINE